MFLSLPGDDNVMGPATCQLVIVPNHMDSLDVDGRPLLIVELTDAQHHTQKWKIHNNQVLPLYGMSFIL